MAKITFITTDNKTTETQATSGSIMELAVANNIKGIDADCGGVCSCATCHVHVAPEYVDRLIPASDLEKDLLEFDDNVSEYSRLSCQLQISDEIDGIVLRVVN